MNGYERNEKKYGDGYLHKDGKKYTKEFIDGSSEYDYKEVDTYNYNHNNTKDIKSKGKSKNKSSSNSSNNTKNKSSNKSSSKSSNKTKTKSNVPKDNDKKGTTYKQGKDTYKKDESGFYIKEKEYPEKYYFYDEKKGKFYPAG